MALLFSLIGCTDETRIWSVVIVNKLPYPIYVNVVFNKYNGSKKSFELSIESEKIAFSRNHMDPSIPSKAHRGIDKISVFLEDQKTPLMILKGNEMNEYVIRVGDYHDTPSYNGWQFCLEIEEINIGVGLNKGMDFEIEDRGDHR